MVLLDALRCYLYAFYRIYHEFVWVTALLYPYILHAEQIVKASKMPTAMPSRGFF